MSPMLRAIWPDGTELLATDAGDLLDRLGRLQWEPQDRDAMKARLADRAWAWSATPVDSLLPDDLFLVALEGAGLLVIDQMADQAKAPGIVRPEEPRYPD